VEIAKDVIAVRRRIDEVSIGPTLGLAGFRKLVDASFEGSSRIVPLSGPGPSRAEIERLVNLNAADYNVDPALIEAVIETESGFDSNATSSAGARGLMQLMPQTAAGLGISDAYDIAQNVRGGTRYLRSLLDRFPDVELAVAAYNAGPGAVEKFGGVPPYAATREYVRTVMEAYRKRSQLGNAATNGGSQRYGIIMP
jgi:soluble lytic murein transglycosylase-like protein